MKRAITLAGGGPAAGLHIGALKRLSERRINFDIWALSCIGAWVGVLFNQFEPRHGKSQAEQTEEFFREHIFRADDSYSRFPINSVFGPDISAVTRAVRDFTFSVKSYDELYLPHRMQEVAGRWMRLCCDPQQWNKGDWNQLMLDTLGANPFMRFFTSLAYLSELNGLSRIYYPESTLARAIDFVSLEHPDKPFLYHNAWNLTKRQLDLFANHNRPGYLKLSFNSLCACSALPFIEQTVDVGPDTYCEGALVDTVNFKNLLDDNPELEEIWVSRIVDAAQVRTPRNLYEALGNLCMLFPASLGNDDIKLFKFHAKERNWRGKIIEINVSADIKFDWSHANLQEGIIQGYRAAEEAWQNYQLMNALVALLRAPEGNRGHADTELPSTPDWLCTLAFQLRQKCFADIVNGWLKGVPLQISIDKVSHWLGFDTLRELERQTGLPRDKILLILSEALPEWVAGLARDGRMPDKEEYVANLRRRRAA